MKNITCRISVLLFLFLLTSSRMNAQNETAIIDKFYESNFRIEKEPLVSDALKKALSGTYYRVNAGWTYMEGEFTEYCSVTTAVVNNGKAEILDLSGKNLLPLVRKDFALKTEEDAKALEAAIDLIFPLIMDEGVKAHNKTGNKWFFVRSKYFEDKTAYVVTIDANSKITGIIYDEHAIKANN